MDIQHPDSDLPKLARPARRALYSAGYWRLEHLTRINESQLKQMHGIGPHAIRMLREALAAQNLDFAPTNQRS